MLFEQRGQVVAGKVQAVWRQVVEKRRGVVVEERQVVFEALRCLAVADLPVEGAVHDFFAVVQAGVLAVTGAPGVGKVQLAARQYADAVPFFQGALVGDGEGADAVDLVVEPFEADGVGGVHRVEIDDVAARGVFAFAADVVRAALIARVIEALDEGIAREVIADGKVNAVFVEVGLRAETLTQGGGAGNDDAVRARRQLGQDTQAFGDKIGMRRVLVIRQRFPVAEPVKRGGVAQPVFEVFVPVFAGARVGGDKELDVFALGLAAEVVGEEGKVHGAGGGVYSYPLRACSRFRGGLG